MLGKVYNSLDEFAGALRNIGNSLAAGAIFEESLYDKVRMVLVSQTKMAFHNSASPSGIPWKPLAHQRVRGGGTPSPLRDTGELMASMTANGPGGVWRIEGFSIVFGSNHVRAWHNEGGVITPVRAKFLCIPATKEAFYAGSPRNFPGKLFFLWNPDTGRGIAIGIASDYRNQGGQAEAHDERRKRIKSLMKTPARIGGIKTGDKIVAKTKASKRTRITVFQIEKMLTGQGQVGRKKGIVWKRVSKVMKKWAKKLGKWAGKKLKKMSAKKPKPKTKTSKPKQKGKSKTSQRKVHYYLRDKVQVPARPFLEITPQTDEKIAMVVADHAASYIEKRIGGE